MSVITAIIAFLTSLPKILSLVETLIKFYELGVKKNEAKLLEKADDEVTQFVRRVQASHGVRVNGVSGVEKINESPTDYKCDCSGAGLCDGCIKNSKPSGISSEK